MPTPGPDSRGGLPGLLDALAELHAHDEAGVLGLVYATAGSTYQKPGALVLLGAAGMIHGAISGGCLEPELEDRARLVQRNGRAQTIEFDTRSDEDLIFGSGTGCRGRIHLLLLPQIPGAPLTRALNRLVAAGGVLEVGLSIDGTETGSGRATVQGEAWSWGRDGQSGLFRDGEATAALRIPAPPRIMLFGAGPETLTLNLFTRRVGWLLQVVEHRGRWLNFAQAAGVQRVIELPPDEAAEVWREQHVSAAIAMTHNYALDMQHLALCATSDFAYVGLLGPSSRRDAMLADLGPDLTSRLQGRLRAPVGLGLGGRGPEPLALAIVAELQQHFANETRPFAKHGLRETTANPSPSL
jgi:xanthine dehydrogenase accessory factor